MPKGRVLSPAEREEIVRMHEAGASGREIAKKLSRSKTVVLNFLKNPAQYAQIKRSGRKRALSGEDERRLYAALFQQRSSSADMNSERSLVSLQDHGIAHRRTEASVAASASVMTDEHASAVMEATEPAHGEAQQQQQQQQRAFPTGLQDMKKSAEQIRKEFNVPLSTRRIQQLLSEWRREAQRAQERQQIAPSQPPERRVAEVEASNVSANDATVSDTAVCDGAESGEVVPSAGQAFADGIEAEAANEPVERVTAVAAPFDQESPHESVPVSVITVPSYTAAVADLPHADNEASPELQETSTSAIMGPAPAADVNV